MFHWRKGNNQTSRSLFDTDAELMLIPGDPKKHCDAPVTVMPYEDLTINSFLAEIWLTVGPVDA